VVTILTHCVEEMRQKAMLLLNIGQRIY